MPLIVQTKHVEPDIEVMELAGRITMGNDCQQVEWTANKLVRENRRKIIFDLSGVTHVDSTGIGIIVAVAGHLREAGGKLRVAGASEHVMQLLKVTCVDQIVEMHPTTDAAVTGF